MLENEIKELIEKSLPKQVGDTLRKVLEKADKDAAELERLKLSLSEHSNTIKTLKSELENYKQFDERNSKLDDREKELDTKERGLEITLLKTKLEESEKRADMVKDFTSGLVRNTIFKKSIFDNESTSGHYDKNGNWVDTQSISKNYTEESTKE